MAISVAINGGTIPAWWFADVWSIHSKDAALFEADKHAQLVASAATPMPDSYPDES